MVGATAELIKQCVATDWHRVAGQQWRRWRRREKGGVADDVKEFGNWEIFSQNLLIKVSWKTWLEGVMNDLP